MRVIRSLSSRMWQPPQAFYTSESVTGIPSSAGVAAATLLRCEEVEGAGMAAEGPPDSAGECTQKDDDRPTTHPMKFCVIAGEIPDRACASPSALPRTCWSSSASGSVDRDMSRPETPEVAVEDIALDRLAQPGGPAGRVRFPPGRERERAAERDVRQHGRLLEGNDILVSSAAFTSSTTRWAFRLMALRCVTAPPPLSPRRDRSARGTPDFAPPARRTFQAGVGPSANPLAVMQVGTTGAAITNVRFVIAPAAHRRPRPARVTFGLVRRCDGAGENRPEPPIDAVVDGSQLVRVALRRIDGTSRRPVGRDAEQAEAGAAGIRLAHALVNLLERVLDVRESVMPVRRDALPGTRKPARGTGRASGRSHGRRSRTC